ncbi:MAG: ribonuclease HII [Patescibacteria group bacterium]
MNIKYEKQLINDGYNFIAGLDEAGRGSWAGPVVAACLIFDLKIPLEKLLKINDSKLLTMNMREKAFDWLIQNFQYGLGVVSHKLIDSLGIVPATKMAMKQAVENLSVQPDYLLIDAVKLSEITIPQENIIKGDRKIWSIAAASIVAKVARDKIMAEEHEKFPQYGFDKHKGYGTRLHYKMLCKHGICEIHRKSYKPIKNLA